jgi:hypothetical protein
MFFTYNSQSTIMVSLKFFLSVRYIPSPMDMVKNIIERMLREHAQNCDVPSRPCPK